MSNLENEVSKLVVAVDRNSTALELVAEGLGSLPPIVDPGIPGEEPPEPNEEKLYIVTWLANADGAHGGRAKVRTAPSIGVGEIVISGEGVFLVKGDIVFVKKVFTNNSGNTFWELTIMPSDVRKKYFPQHVGVSGHVFIGDASIADA